MTTMLWLGGSQLCKDRHCRDHEHASHLHDRFFGRQWLHQSKADIQQMQTLRSLVAQHSSGCAVSGMSDEEVADHVAELVASGRVHMHAPTLPAYAPVSAGSQGPAPAPFPLSGRTSSPQMSFGAPADAPTFPSDLDGAAQANALAAAASGGQPFCPQ